jgi:hypothetical protein
MVNNETNRVDNVIVWDGVSDYAPPEGYTLAEIPPPSETSPTPGEGWFYIDGAFVEITTDSLTPQDAPNVIAE